MATERRVKDMNDVTITTLEGQAEGWKEHFHEVLNRPTPEEQAEIGGAANTTAQ